MRHLLIMAFAGLLFIGCKNFTTGNKAVNVPFATVDDSTKFTTMEWKEQNKKFDKITEGQKLDVSFAFKNTGDKPLIISQVQASCGCTVAEPPKEPIAPGADGLIKASFNSEGREGLQHKTLSVHANTKGTQDYELVFEVEVVKK